MSHNPPSCGVHITHIVQVPLVNIWEEFPIFGRRGRGLLPFLKVQAKLLCFNLRELFVLQCLLCEVLFPSMYMLVPRVQKIHAGDLFCILFAISFSVHILFTVCTVLKHFA